MKENFEKAKEFMSEHKYEIVLIGTIGSAVGFGFVLGQWSVLSNYREFTGIGAEGMLDYIRANGLEAAEEMVKEAYRSTKPFRRIK